VLGARGNEWRPEVAWNALRRKREIVRPVAPEVQTIAPPRRGAAPRPVRVRVRRERAALPYTWLLAGLPKSPSRVRHSAMTAATRGSTGVVAA
jgi:hypothetical protein